jgi:hypothetical protein
MIVSYAHGAAFREHHREMGGRFAWRPRWQWPRQLRLDGTGIGARGNGRTVPPVGACPFRIRLVEVLSVQGWPGMPSSDCRRRLSP